LLEYLALIVWICVSMRWPSLLECFMSPISYWSNIDSVVVALEILSFPVCSVSARRKLRAVVSSDE
jgi:hypothetical protein